MLCPLQGISPFPISKNKIQHRKLAMENKILPPPLPGFELATFRSRVRHSANELSRLPALYTAWVPPFQTEGCRLHWIPVEPCMHNNEGPFSWEPRTVKVLRWKTGAGQNIVMNALAITRNFSLSNFSFPGALNFILSKNPNPNGFFFSFFFLR